MKQQIYTLEQYNSVLSLVKSGLNFTETGQKLGIHKGRIRDWAILNRKPKRFSEKFKENIKRAHEKTQKKFLVPVLNENFGYVLLFSKFLGFNIKRKQNKLEEAVRLIESKGVNNE